MQHDLTSYVNLTSSACTACFIGPNVCQADILNHLPQVSEVSDSQSYAAYFETTWMDGCIREDKRDCHDCAIKMWKLSDKRLLFWWGACGRYDDVAVMIIRDNEAELRCWQLTWKSRRFVEEPGANPAVDRLNNQLKQGWLNLCLTITSAEAGYNHWNHLLVATSGFCIWRRWCGWENKWDVSILNGSSYWL